jgi:TonB family protein
MRAPLVLSVAAHALVAVAVLSRGASRPDLRARVEVDIERETDVAVLSTLVDVEEHATSPHGPSRTPEQDSPRLEQRVSPASERATAPAEGAHGGIGYAPIGYDSPQLLEQIQHQIASWSPYLVAPVRKGAPAAWAPHDEFLEGHVPRAFIERAVAAQMHTILLCHGAGGRGSLSLAGDVRVSFTIDPQGKVTDAHDAGGSFADAAVHRCVVDAFRKLTFPWPPNGKPQTVTHDVFMGAEEPRPR